MPSELFWLMPILYLVVGLFVAIQAYSADPEIGAKGFLIGLFLWIAFLK